MAVTNIKPIKSKSAMTNSEDYIVNKEKTLYIDNAVNYLENMEKTLLEEGEQLVSGYNCDPATFKLQAKMLMDNYYQNKKENLLANQQANYAFHFLLSFKQDKTELDPKKVQNMANEFCSRFLGPNFIALTAVHLNTDNVHAHILVPAFAKDGRHKFRDNYDALKRMRDISDEIALENGLEIILNPKEKTGKSHYEYTKEKDGKSWKDQLKQDILGMAAASKNWDEYETNMKALGYELKIKDGKDKVKRYITYTKNDVSLSDSKLPIEYRSEGINNLIRTQKERKLLSDERSKQKNHKPYDPVYVPRYDITGHRLSGLERLIELMKIIVSSFKDNYNSAALSQLYPSREYYKAYTDKLQRIEEAQSLINKYQLNTTNELMQRINENQRKGIRNQTILDRETKIDLKLSDLQEKVNRFQELQKRMKDLGISDNELYLYRSYDLERRRNLAALDPANNKQLSKLHKLTQSAGLKLKYDYNLLTKTQVNEVIDYIKNPNKTKKPDIVITNAEARQAYLSKKYAGFYDKNLAKLYEKDTEATKAQMKKVSDLVKKNPELLQIDTESLTKTDAIRIINKYAENPLKKEIIVKKSDPITESNLKTLQELKELYPDEFKDCPIDLKDFDKKLYKDTYNYLLAKTDEIIPDQPEETHKKIKLSDFNKDTVKEIKEYCKLYKELDSFDISPEKIPSFLQKKADHDKLIAELNEEQQAIKDTQKELNVIQNIINKATDKGFLFGPLYRGNTIALNDQVKEVLFSDYKYNELLQIKNDLQLVRSSRVEVKNFSYDKLEKYKSDYDKATEIQLNMLNKFSYVFNELRDINIEDLSFNSAEKLLSYIAFKDKDETKIDTAIKEELERLERKEQIKQIQPKEQER